MARHPCTYICTNSYTVSVSELSFVQFIPNTASTAPRGGDPHFCFARLKYRVPLGLEFGYTSV